MSSHFVNADNLQHADFPWCHVEVMSNGDIVGAKQIILVRATFPPGSTHKFHKHPGREEIIYVLEGTADQWVGEQRRLLKAGEMAHIPSDLPHSTHNPGPEPLKFLAILSPLETGGELIVDVFEEEPWVSLVKENR